MVFFTCNACGESVKKVQVEKHVSVCRSCDSLSCIDCGRDFWGDDYKNHVKCVSEDQKYGGKGYEGKTHKGDVKQQAWIQEPVSTGQAQPPPDQAAGPRAETPAQPPTSKAGEATAKPAEAKKKKREKKGDRQKEEPELENHQETPKGQKPKKCKKGQGAGLEANGEDTPTANGSARKRSKKRRQGEEAADGGGAGQEETPSAVGKRKRKHAEGVASQRPSQDAETESKKKKMKLAGQAEGGEADEQQPVKGKFNWKGTIKAVLKQAPDNEISIKKLKKKVLAQYYTVTSDCHKSEEELLVIFNKKISKNPTFRLLKDKVKLLK
nr:cell growth-regulating nucleolar protein isoform X3 [Oryctolagus cuniculus]